MAVAGHRYGGVLDGLLRLLLQRWLIKGGGFALPSLLTSAPPSRVLMLHIPMGLGSIYAFPNTHHYSTYADHHSPNKYPD